MQSRWKQYVAKLLDEDHSEEELILKQAKEYINTAFHKNWVEFYQPTHDPNKYFSEIAEQVCRKNTSERFDFIRKNLETAEISSYLDIGSQIGYFVFKMNEWKGAYSIGIEMDRIAHNIAQNISLANKIDNVGFINGKISVENVKQLPKVDVISFLNVFHHINHFENFKAADSIVKSLLGKCKYFIFETGQYNEKGYYWTDALSFMSDNSDEWVYSYLQELGFEIINTNSFGTHLSEKKRLFCICKSTANS